VSWLITQTLEALNLEHVQRLYADKAKVKAVITGFPVTVAADLDPDVARRVVRDIVDQVAQGYSVEVVDGEVRRVTTLR
jgi:RNase H-fold protein (predicted Holliday junction resolvase)